MSPTFSPITKNPKSVAAAGSTVASTAALPAVVLLRPSVYKRNGITAVTTAVRRTNPNKESLLSTADIFAMRSGGLATNIEPKPAMRNVYHVTVEVEYFFSANVPKIL